jgi:hypothetical protein
MTTAADDATDEIAFEAFLAGRPVPAQADGSSPAVATFAGAVRATATLPGRPNAALAELLATGLLTDQPSPSTRTAPSTGKSPRRSRFRRRRFAMFLPALAAKFLSLSAVAQAASGVGIAVVAFTGAGATGLLGTDVQTSLSSVVGAAETTSDVTPTVTPSDTPTATPTDTPTATPTDTPTATGVTPAVGTPAAPALTPESWAEGPAAGQAFGDWVSAGARLGYVDGATISKFAHTRNEERKAGAPATSTTAPEATSTDGSTTDGAQPAATTTSTTTGGSEHGNSQHADSGHGHN